MKKVYSRELLIWLIDINKKINHNKIIEKHNKEVRRDSSNLHSIGGIKR